MASRTNSAAARVSAGNKGGFTFRDLLVTMVLVHSLGAIAVLIWG